MIPYVRSLHDAGADMSHPAGGAETLSSPGCAPPMTDVKSRCGWSILRAPLGASDRCESAVEDRCQVPGGTWVEKDQRRIKIRSTIADAPHQFRRWMGVPDTLLGGPDFNLTAALFLPTRVDLTSEPLPAFFVRIFIPIWLPWIRGNGNENREAKKHVLA
jgi:hypothetical protein